MKIFSKAYIFYLCFWVLVCLIALEIFVRVRSKHLYGFQDGSVSELYKYDATFDLRLPVPNSEIKGAKTHIEINSLGFRGDEFEVTKQPSTVRIAALGASTTFCAEVSDNEHTWPELVRVKLAQKYPGYIFEMINGGVPGYTISSSLKNLRRRILRLQPDIILLYHATNDIAYESRKAAIGKGLIAEGQNHHGSKVIFFLSSYSQAFDLIYKNLIIRYRQSKTNVHKKLTASQIDFAKPFIAYLDSIKMECKEHDMPLFVFTFSTKFRRHQTKEEQLKNMNTAFYYMPWMKQEAILSAFESFNRTMWNYAQRKQNVFVDTLHKSIPGDSKNFVDSVHFTNEGANAMANRVVNALVREDIIQHVIERRQ